MAVLVSYRPAWLATGGTRYGMGIEILCPGHPYARHCVQMWFANPLDGGLPADDWQLYHRRGATLDVLTIEGVVAVPDHCAFRLTCGELTIVE